jgi:hypothetical protein
LLSPKIYKIVINRLNSAKDISVSLGRVMIGITRKSDTHITKKSEITITKKSDNHITKKSEINITKKSDNHITKKSDNWYH